MFVWLHIQPDGDNHGLKQTTAFGLFSNKELADIIQCVTVHIKLYAHS